MTVRPDFLDSNVLIYSYDPRDSRKQEIAQKLVLRAIQGDALASTQVLAEFASTLLHKMTPAARLDDVKAVLDTLSPIKLVLPDEGIVRRAVEARAAYGIHFYDGMIVAAAERGGCERIWSEDLNSGQKYFGVVVENPFLAA
jgi:predicted nucleic acid-binding protein